MISRWEKFFVGLSILLTAATGLVYAWMKYFVEPADPFSVVNHPWQPGLLSAHVLAAPLLLFAFGLIAREHLLGRFRDPRARKSRASGLLAVSALVPMVASGYLTQVLTSTGGRRAAGLIHLGSGLLFFSVYGFHLARAWRRTEAEEEAAARVEGHGRGPGARAPVRPERLALVIATGRAGKGSAKGGRP